MSVPMENTYEEIRKAVIDILSGHRKITYPPNQFRHLELGVAEVLNTSLTRDEKEIFLEIFWDLFRTGIITLGIDAANPNFPWCRVSSFGKKILKNQDLYFFHDVSSYEKIVRESIPDIDPVTLVYLKEAMQTFLSGCYLSSTVMIGVSNEHSFLKLLETVEKNAKYKPKFKNVFTEKTILQKLIKFINILHQIQTNLTPDIKEDLDTNFSGIVSMIRNFRNESGHPTGKIISREQCYILLHLFIPACKKIYQLINFFK